LKLGLSRISGAKKSHWGNKCGPHAAKIELFNEGFRAGCRPGKSAFLSLEVLFEVKVNHLLPAFLYLCVLF
jgi:hypothetical protein